MKKTIIIAYHDIDSKEQPTEKKDLPTIQTVVRIEEFEDHMRYLAEAGYSVLSVRDYINRGHLGGKNLVLTFDDGHISNYRFALPVLCKYAFSATFFVISDYINKPHYMGTSEIVELIKKDMEIGSHGKSHSYLTELSTKEIDLEINESKRVLENQFSLTVDTFAYPGGHQNSQIVESVEMGGYKTAVSCIHGRNSIRTNPYLLRRVEVRRGTSVKELQIAISATNIMFFQVVDTLKLLLKKTLGLKKYEKVRQKLYYLYPFNR